MARVTENGSGNVILNLEFQRHSTSGSLGQFGSELLGGTSLFSPVLKATIFLPKAGAGYVGPFKAILVREGASWPSSECSTGLWTFL